MVIDPINKLYDGNILDDKGLIKKELIYKCEDKKDISIRDLFKENPDIFSDDKEKFDCFIYNIINIITGKDYNYYLIKDINDSNFEKMMELLFILSKMDSIQNKLNPPNPGG